jgi:serine/threonine protein kinase/tetratricopeptide (TPR) repeat protein
MNEPTPRDKLGREETIFNAAVQLGDAAKRAIYLDLACENDPALRARIEKLLASDAGDNFFAQPLAKPVFPSAAAAAAPEAPEAQPLGERIGRYRLLQKIGEGGLGLVYMAKQEEPVRRRVALKVIRLGMDTESVIARFEAERQALAMMDHPNIAKILDGGVTETGRPYFVMDLVQGLPITQFCDEARLSTRGRLDLFRDVCSAIQHAHQKGIIHRDLKPSNILVTLHGDKPVPKVIDFGIAKATQQRLTDKTLFTQFQQFLGTPAYVSPEQATLSGLDIDTRSDIYSLGVLLYELLTGKTPFDSKELLKAGLEEMRRTICEKEPPTPSTRVSTMHGDELTTTAQRRGLEPPKLISQLRGDLDWIVMKCLEKDRARRYETANALAMDIQRHLNNEPVVASPPSAIYRFQKLLRRNRGVFTALGVIFVLLVLGVGISTWEAFRARRAEREQMRLRQQAQTEAAKSKEVARFLEEMLGGAGPSVARGRDATILREIMDKAAERVEKDLKNEPEVQGDLNYRLGLTYADLGDFQKRERLMQRAVEEYTAAFGNEHCKLALALCTLGAAQDFLDKATVGRATAEKGLGMARRCGDKRTLSSCLYYTSKSLLKGGLMTVAEQEPYLREAVALQRELADDPATLARYVAFLAIGLTNLNEAEQLQREALGLHRQILGTNDPDVGHDLYSLAQILQQEWKLDEAKGAALEALEIGRKIKQGYELRREIEFAVFVLMFRSEWDEGERILRQGVEESPSSAETWEDFACFEARRTNWATAADYSARATELVPDENSFWLTRAALLLRLGRLEDYRRYCHQILERAAGRHDPSIAAFDPALQFAGGQDPSIAAASPALLLPVEGGDFERACQFVDLEGTVSKPVDYGPWFEFWKALAEYRRGRFNSAREWAARSRSRDGELPRWKAPSAFLEAMAWARLQKPESAKAALAGGDEIVKKVLVYAHFMDVKDWLVADLLRIEAQGLLDGTVKADEAKR